jgi:hypothetical protein
MEQPVANIMQPVANIITSAALAFAACGIVAAQPAARPRACTAPKTDWGAPDLQGTWNYATMTPLERPRDLDKAVLSAEEASAYETRTNDRQRAANNTAGPDWWDPGTQHLVDRRTSLLVDPPDGRLPPTTPEAQARAARNAQARRQRGELDGPEDLALNVRCLLWATAGPPMLPGVYNNDVQIVQTPAFVVIYNEMIHDARIVPMDGRPHGRVRQWMGDSRGHWEGPTLVIDTIDFTDRTPVRGSDSNLHLVERFTRSDRDTIQYEFTMDDPGVWTRPWTAAFPMRHTDEPMYEYACHEGNARSIEGLLRAARVGERDRPR